MGIEALPSSTVRAIGATQVLNDPASLIKELIDNALDAQSTSIAIEIHSNTLDTIQVRDNGHGIPAEDRELVARPHCTSKISGEDDLKAIGGTSLGFRGEALASAAEMSGSLTISTRVEVEEVATALKIDQQGAVIGTDRASLPVGTTVKITDFIKAHPVRKQVALKNAEKTLGKIKQTLKAYAFARSHVRLSLRVLKAKNDKGNWTYAPKADGNAEDAAFKIVGTACSSQCIWSMIEDEGYALQAFLPKADADTSKYSNTGAFISVDGRPVSVSRGTPKQISKIFREALKKTNSEASNVKEPFLFLDIQCPSGSYDANVEPAKDDVLFEDPDKIIAIVRQLFEAAYPVVDLAAGTAETPLGSILDDIATKAIEHPHATPRLEDDDFIASLEAAATSACRPRESAPWTPFPTRKSLRQRDDAGDTPATVCPPRRAFRSNMYGCDEEDVDAFDERPPTGRTEADFAELRQARHDVNVSNPWIMAKMNAASRKQPEQNDDDSSVAYGRDTLPFQHGEQDQMCDAGDLAPGLPTPKPSSPLKSSFAAFRPPAAALESSNQGSRLISGSQMLSPRGQTIMPPPPATTADGSEDEQPNQDRRHPAYNYDLSSPQTQSHSGGTALRNIPNASSRPRQSPKKQKQSQLNTPFKSPVSDQPPREKVWFDHLENIDQTRPHKRAYQPWNNDGLVVQGELGDLIDDPRSLTPPRRNRDMRDFLTLRDQDVGHSVADIIEAGHYAPQMQNEEHNEMIPQADENQPFVRAGGVLSGRGFVPASDLAAFESRFGPLKPDTSRPKSKRRKTGEDRALREISGNASAQDVVPEDEDQAIVGSRAASVRRPNTDGDPGKARRRKSSRLPLERVPKGQETHNISLVISANIRDLADAGRALGEEALLLTWNATALDAQDAFSNLSEPDAMTATTARLRALLIKHVPDGEMIQDLGTVVQGALAAHAEGTMETEE